METKGKDNKDVRARIDALASGFRKGALVLFCQSGSSDRPGAPRDAVGVGRGTSLTRAALHKREVFCRLYAGQERAKWLVTI